MATLVLASAGAALGANVGGSVMFGLISSAALGQGVGAAVGSVIDGMLLNAIAGPQRVKQPEVRLATPSLATEGRPLAKGWGHFPASPQLWWSSKYRVVERTETSRAGGKGLGGQKVETTTREVYISAMYALHDGEIAGIGDVRFDGVKIDKSKVDMRVYLGTETQEVDPTIAALDPDAPAFRGVAYIVFTDLDVTGRGALPQVSVECRRPAEIVERSLPAVAYAAGDLATADTAAGEPESRDLESLVKGACLTPGTGKWALHPRPINASDGEGTVQNVNQVSGQAVSDAVAALDQLQQACPNLESVTIIVSWFGSTLEAGTCTVLPKAESRDDIGAALASGETVGAVAVDSGFSGAAADASAWSGIGLGADTPEVPESPKQNEWRVSGEALADVDLISEIDGRPAYGATPSDRSVWALIRECEARGLAVTLLPFLLMDDSPDYTWRGRIGSANDGTATATSDIAAFMGTAAASEFGVWDGRTIPFTGSGGGWRRCVLHYAKLAAEAGGVDGFVIGTEFRGLERVRDEAGGYPFVAALRTLAADVDAILPGAKIGYAADWSSYANHRPDDGSDDVIFNLDPLWADPAIDFVGIDNYLPLADWRDGFDHADYVPGRSIYDLGYLRANIEAGEGWTWFYASQADRDAQIRTPIVDSADGEHYVFGVKRLREWWANPHHDRPGGVRSATPTAWTAKMKPIWFVELGCPAVDLGANQPNVFVDPKSVENALPYYSTGAPDAAMQRAFLLAHLTYWRDENEAGFIEKIDVYAFDLRPWPAFPLRADVWGDAASYATAHTLNGRLGAMPVGLIMAELAAEAGAPLDWRDCFEQVTGYVVDDGSAPRGVIEQLAALRMIDVFEDRGVIVARSRSVAPIVDLTDAEFCERDEPVISVTRADPVELPREVGVQHYGPADGFPPRRTIRRRRIGAESADETVTAPVVASAEEVGGWLDIAHAERFIGREQMAATLAPAQIERRPGDVIRDAEGRTWRLLDVSLAWARDIRAVKCEPGLYRGAPPARPNARETSREAVAQASAPILRRLDLPLLASDATAHAPYFAAWANPWPQAGVQVWRSPDGDGFDADALVPAPSILGVLTAALPAAGGAVVDRGAALEVRTYGGALASTTAALLWSGANAMAVLGDDGEWEIVQFQTATAIGANAWRLTTLRRGRGGTAHASGASIGQPVAFLAPDALAQPLYPLSSRGVTFTWRYGEAGLPISDPAIREFSEGFVGVGLRPWPVAQPVARRTDAGDVAFTFRRRARLGGGAPGPEPALGFNLERYRVRVWNGSTLLRTITHSGPPPVAYAAADASADHGGRPSVLDWDAAQLDDSGAPGPILRQTQEV